MKVQASSRVLLIGVAAAFLIIGVFLLSWKLLHTQRTVGKIYAQVGDHKIDQAEVTSTSKGTVGLSQDKVVTVLLDRWLYYYVAKDYRLSVSDQEVKQELTKRYGSVAILADKNYATAVALRDLYLLKLQAYFAGYYQGKFIIVHFDQHLPFVGRNDTTNPPQGRDQRIADDRKYATTLVNSLYDRLTKRKIDFDQAIKLERGDPRIGLTGLPTSIHSSSFDTADAHDVATQLMATPGVTSVLTSTKTGSISKPFVVKVATSVNNSTPEADGFWLILQVNAAKLKNGGDFQSMIQVKKISLHYRKLL